jgi:hypothetical protein
MQISFVYDTCSDYTRQWHTTSCIYYTYLVVYVVLQEVQYKELDTSIDKHNAL